MTSKVYYCRIFIEGLWIISIYFLIFTACMLIRMNCSRFKFAPLRPGIFRGSSLHRLFSIHMPPPRRALRSVHHPCQAARRWGAPSPQNAYQVKATRVPSTSPSDTPLAASRARAGGLLEPRWLVENCRTCRTVFGRLEFLRGPTRTADERLGLLMPISHPIVNKD